MTLKSHGFSENTLDESHSKLKTHIAHDFRKKQQLNNQRL